MHASVSRCVLNALIKVKRNAYKVIMWDWLYCVLNEAMLLAYKPYS